MIHQVEAVVMPAAGSPTSTATLCDARQYHFPGFDSVIADIQNMLQSPLVRKHYSKALLKSTESEVKRSRYLLKGLERHQDYPNEDDTMKQREKVQKTINQTGSDLEGIHRHLCCILECVRLEEAKNRGIRRIVRPLGKMVCIMLRPLFGPMKEEDKLGDMLDRVYVEKLEKMNDKLESIVMKMLKMSK